MISEEGSPQKADADSFPTDTLNTNDWIDEQSRNMMNIELSKSWKAVSAPSEEM